ncbi:hypothetical protein HNR46_004215 [Haloferula luteola]|uniref:Uncharacterized protein n=1 Tax=Haloferula luteola TaxID=595692 RepID=A0A840V7E9_9BACT|nr:hypothetical protein [Haloferula luteola]MBB5353945.1 hypothetical protein [Haloferula luteola]
MKNPWLSMLFVGFFYLALMVILEQFADLGKFSKGLILLVLVVVSEVMRRRLGLDEKSLR